MKLFYFPKFKKIVANGITIGNLLCGCLSISSSFHHDFLGSLAWIVLGLVLDFTDGLVARLLKTESELGKELDSLSDLVSFGLAPAMIVYGYLDPIYGQNSGILRFLPEMAWMIPIFSAIRLGRFNLGKAQYKEGFIGMPTPANALLIGSLPLVSISNPNIFLQLVLNPFLVFGFIILCSFWLISPIRLFNLKFTGFSWIQNRIRFIFLIIESGFIVILLLIRQYYLIIPFILFIYIIYSFFSYKTSKT